MKDERKMMSFRLPIEARDRMQRLMSIHNAPSQADVILMALDALESVAPAPAVSAQLDDVVTRIERMFDDMLARIDTMQQHFAAFEVRLSAIEAGAGESTIVEKAGADADVNDAGADKKRTRKTADFDPDVWIVSVSQISEDLQRECVQMLRNKIDKDDIVTMVETKIGKKMTRQFKNNFKTKSLESWVNLYPETVHPKIEPHWGYAVFGSDNLLQLANWVAYGKSTEFIEAWVKATLGVDTLPDNFHADLAELVKQGEWVRADKAREANLS